MIDEISLRAAVVTELYNAQSNDDPDYWVKVMVEHDSSQFTTDWPYWQHRIATGDGVGKAPHGPGPAAPVTDQPSAPPGPSATLVMAGLQALEDRVMARFSTLESMIAAASAPQAFTGSAAIPYIGTAPIALTAKKP